jgi:hypothetical protein
VRPIHITLTAAVLSAAPSLVFAAVPKKHAKAEAQARLEAEHAIKLATGAQLLAARSYEWEVPASKRAAWRAFVEQAGPGWTAYFDRTTEVPSRIYGGSLRVAGAMTSPALAEQHARSVLRDHLDLLAPGSSADDFVLVSNVTDGRMRTVGFIQRYGGLEVIGGQVSFRYKNDRLFVIGSEAWPHVAIERANRIAPSPEAMGRAAEWVAADFGPTARAEGVKGPFILGLRRGSGVDYQTVLEARVRTENPVGLWSVWVDAASAQPIARKQRLMFSTGTIQFNSPERWPGGTRVDAPASFANVVIGGANITADEGGVLNYMSAGTVQATARTSGREINVVTQSGTSTATTFTLEPNGTHAWNASRDERADAQLITYIATTQVRAYAKKIAPSDPWFTQQWQANVNIDQSCNAYSDGETTNFFVKDSQCENTGRLPDVVAHESGHGIHAHAIIQGAGNFDTDLSEGVSDYLSATWHDDPAMGLGFFFDNQPLRHLDPPNEERKWPDDINQDPHETGLIIGGALWDLRKSLIQKMGHDDGIKYTDQLWYGILQRAADIPSSYVEVLADDDDDGNIMNGTPNQCEINAAFALHGLADKNTSGPGIQTPTIDGFTVTMNVQPNTQCPGARVAAATLAWHLRENPMIAGSIPMIADAQGGAYKATIPTPDQKNVVINYKISVDLTDRSSMAYPDNPADPEYQLFSGSAIALYCTDFEKDPAQDGWTHSLESGRMALGADDWQWGGPTGKSGSDDPASALSGAHAIGNDLALGDMWDGKYQSSIKNSMASPPIDLKGHKNVHLQYKRWLSVEDGVYDHARIVANEMPLWSNAATDMTRGTVHHVDREWRFHDVDLTSAVSNDTMIVKFVLESDQGFELGGWNVDDFCVVALPECGNGTVEPGEDCDLGAMADPTQCTSTCTKPTMTPPDMQPGMTPPDMTMNPGNPANPDQMSGGLQTVKERRGCGCSSAEKTSMPTALSILLALPLLLVRRRAGLKRRR